MRTYETDLFEITFQGDLISVDIIDPLLKKYIDTKYKSSLSYEHKGEMFFTINMNNFSTDEICEDMDKYCRISELSDEEIRDEIISLLTISSTKVRKEINDYIRKIQSDVPDAGTIEQQHISEKQTEIQSSKSRERSDDSII